MDVWMAEWLLPKANSSWSATKTQHALQRLEYNGRTLNEPSALVGLLIASMIHTPQITRATSS